METKYDDFSERIREVLSGSSGAFVKGLLSSTGNIETSSRFIRNATDSFSSKKRVLSAECAEIRKQAEAIKTRTDSAVDSAPKGWREEKKDGKVRAGRSGTSSRKAGLIKRSR